MSTSRSPPRAAGRSGIASRHGRRGRRHQRHVQGEGEREVARRPDLGGLGHRDVRRHGERHADPLPVHHREERRECVLRHQGQGSAGVHRRARAEPPVQDRHPRLREVVLARQQPAGGHLVA